jgi:hypothetical protein
MFQNSLISLLNYSCHFPHIFFVIFPSYLTWMFNQLTWILQHFSGKIIYATLCTSGFPFLSFLSVFETYTVTLTLTRFTCDCSAQQALHLGFISLTELTPYFLHLILALCYFLINFYYYVSLIYQFFVLCASFYNLSFVIWSPCFSLK